MINSIDIESKSLKNIFTCQPNYQTNNQEIFISEGDYSNIISSLNFITPQPHCSLLDKLKYLSPVKIYNGLLNLNMDIFQYL